MDVLEGAENRSALIAYGSETGNSYDYAEELGCLFERLRFWTHVAELKSLTPASMLSTCSGSGYD